MKFERIVKQEVEVVSLHADIGVRYFEDASVNGIDEEDDAPKMPLISGGRWIITVDLETGVIAGWPKGTTAETHYKVCDGGIYSLIGQNGEVVCRKDGYIPAMLSPANKGYGDYVCVKIGPDGAIKNWRADLSYFDDE